MKFTQFKFPYGRKELVIIDRGEPIERKASQLAEAGWSFEIECHPHTQMVQMDCCDSERVLSNRICVNGPDVPVKVDELVEEAHARWEAEDKPWSATGPLICWA